MRVRVGVGVRTVFRVRVGVRVRVRVRIGECPRVEDIFKARVSGHGEKALAVTSGSGQD